MDGGTLNQLRNLINRRNVTKDPTKNYTANEEFFTLVTEGHILCAAMEVFGMRSLNDQPSTTYIPDGSSQLDPLQRRSILITAVRAIVDKFVNLSYCLDKEMPQAIAVDSVYEYACEVLTLGMFQKEFDDCIREGDGLRDVRCWRYFLLLFKSNHRTNYSIEAFILLCQYHFMLSPRLAMQLTWSRTVNTHGLPGRNIPCDLHMEYLNRAAKESLRGLGSNITDNAVKRVGKSIGEIIKIIDHFDKDNNIKKLSGRHSKRTKKKDMDAIVKQLSEVSGVFSIKEGRTHRYFKNFKNNSMQTLSMENLKTWMDGQLERLLLYYR